ncbi:MAG: TIGR02147 family protein [Bdellovibrionota bacterium]
MDQKISIPIVFDYMDVVVYLQDYYKARKGLSKSFSYQTWSEELGLQSRSFLRMMLTGKKKVTAKFVNAYCEKAFSQKQEKEYFSLLTSYSQAVAPKIRHESSKKMFQILNLHTSVKTIPYDKRFISSPLLPRLLSLLGYKDLQATAAYYAKVLNKELQDIQIALEALQTLGLADNVSSEHGIVWFSLTEVFKVPDQYGNFDLMKFHEQSLLEAIAAFSLPKEERKYRSLLLQLSTHELDEFNQALDEFARNMMTKFNAKSCLGKKMYQTNFNIYPVSHTLGLCEA